MGDWFPFGAAACARYELLKRIPLLPHEELLCKEAISVGASSALVSSKARREVINMSVNDVKRQHSVKVAFVRLVRFQHQVRWLLQRCGAQIICRSPGFDGSVMCVLCKHMCYLAFLTCRCSSTPMCLNHAKEIRDCKCGAGRSVIVREGLPELEQTVLRFEEEDTVRREAYSHPKVEVATRVTGIVMEEDMLGSEDYNGYSPLGDQLLSTKISSVSSQAMGVIHSIGEKKAAGATKAVIETSQGSLCVGHPGDQSSLSSSTESVLPASAKRKRSFTITRRAAARSNAQERSKGGYVEQCESLDMSSDEEDDDKDEEYWPS